MQNNNKKWFSKGIGIAYAFVVWMLFMCRLWTFLIAVLLIGLCVVVYSLLTTKNYTIKDNNQEQKTGENQSLQPQIQDWYSALLLDITRTVQEEYPSANWVWEKAYTKQRIEQGEDIFILLNKAGGYRKAKVQVQSCWLEGIEYLTAIQPQPLQEKVEEEIQEIPVNYSLIACEWVEGCIGELNDQCSEAIAQGKNEVVLTEKELPQETGSWAEVCAELQRIGFSGAEQIPDGIKITLSVEQTEKE